LARALPNSKQATRLRQRGDRHDLDSIAERIPLVPRVDDRNALEAE